MKIVAPKTATQRIDACNIPHLTVFSGEGVDRGGRVWSVDTHLFHARQRLHYRHVTRHQLQHLRWLANPELRRLPERHLGSFSREGVTLC